MLKLLLLIINIILFHIFIAPSAPPTSVNIFEVTSSSITVQWGIVPCIHHNGDITGYLVQYRMIGSESTQTKNISESDAGDTTLSKLASSTNYSIRVAAVNNAGTGKYSAAIIAETNGKKLNSLFDVLKCAYIIQ